MGSVRSAESELQIWASHLSLWKKLLCCLSHEQQVTQSDPTNWPRRTTGYYLPAHIRTGGIKVPGFLISPFLFYHNRSETSGEILRRPQQGVQREICCCKNDCCCCEPDGCWCLPFKQMYAHTANVPQRKNWTSKLQAKRAKNKREMHISYAWKNLHSVCLGTFQ